MITPHAEYLQLGLTAYREFFTAHMDPDRINEIRKATNGNYALGSERFKAEIEQTLKRRATPGKSGWPIRELVVCE